MSSALDRRIPAFIALLVVPLAFAPCEGASPSQGARAADMIGAAAYAEIKAAGKAVRTDGKAGLELLPKQAAAVGLRALVEAQKPGIVVEALFCLPRKRPDDPAARKAELASIYGLMRSFGTLEGIEYYSVTHGKMRTLYTESYRIDDQVRRSRLPDQGAPAADALPASESVLVFQNDTSFGANVYRYSFASFPDALLVEATNLTRMSYGIVPMVAAEALKTRLLVICAEDAIVFYSESGADAPALFRSRVGSSFANRAEALFRWFSAEATFLDRE